MIEGNPQDSIEASVKDTDWPCVDNNEQQSTQQPVKVCDQDYDYGLNPKDYVSVRDLQPGYIIFGKEILSISDDNLQTRVINFDKDSILLLRTHWVLATRKNS